MDIRNRLLSRRSLTFIALLIALSLGIGIGTFVSDQVLSAEESTGVALLDIEKEGSSSKINAISIPQEGFAEVAAVVEPTVVNISMTAVVRRNTPQSKVPEGDKNFFGNEFWERFFGPLAPEERKATSLGSGVIVDAQGYILTNYHVIGMAANQGGAVRIADKIEVTLYNDATYLASVVGQDPESDLAVLKIDVSKDLPFAMIGDSSKVRVGDRVLAIGNPFGVGQTVTSGIVSAIKRVIPSQQIFGDYIQTDAAINPGNSGGPLVNLRGEVIGINTFIFTRSGGSQGIGFAVPSAVFVNSYNQIVSKGRIERGWLGVSMNYDLFYPMTPEMADFFGVSGKDPAGVRDGDGVIVTNLINEDGQPDESGPAYQAGVRSGDVIVKFGDREIETTTDLRSEVANTPPGDVKTMVVIRQGKVLSLSVTLAERQLERRAQEGEEGFSFEQRAKPERRKEIGLEFETLRAEVAEKLGLKGETGVRILEITVGSLADEAGLRVDQVITHVNGKPMRTAQSLYDEIKSLSSGKGVVIRIISADPRERRKNIAYTSFVKP